MILAHLADLHLGYRAYERETAKGQNQRSVDVGNAFRWCVDDILASKPRPEVVLMAGDIFDHLTPTNQSALLLMTEVTKLRQADLDVVMIGGNHDSPRTSMAASFLPMFQVVGCVVAHGAQIKTVEIRGQKFVLAPSGAPCLLKAEHAPGAILVCHGEYKSFGEPTRDTIPDGILDLEQWIYCALGHEHVAKKVGHFAWYSGSTDYVSTDIWGEYREEKKLEHPGKGYLRVDTAAGTVVIRPISPKPRIVVDLPMLSGEFKHPDTVSQEVDEALSTLEENSIARLVVTDIPRTVKQALDWEMIKRHRTRLLHLSLNFRLPAVDGAVERMREHYEMTKSLPDLVREFLTGRAKELGDAVNAEEFVKTGVELVEKAQKGDREQT